MMTVDHRLEGVDGSMGLSMVYQFLFVVVTWPARRSKEVQVDVEIATGTFFSPGSGVWEG